ncbi:MAG TPA: class I SAM-dependent methyltransferase [Flavipsychrobacter sp.]
MKDNIKHYDAEYIRELFNRMSTSYERVNFITSFGFSLRWRREFVIKAGKSHQKLQIIDLLTGMGESWHPIKKNFPNAQLTALDFSEGMLHHCRQRNKRLYNGQVTVTNQDILCNNLTSNSFDYIFCSFGLKTFNNEQLLRFAKEILRILKPGGKFHFIEISLPENKALQYLLKVYLKQAIPLLGRILLGNPREYRMLSEYTETFKNAKEALNIFGNVGLIVEYDSYFHGCATGVHGYKQVT